MRYRALDANGDYSFGAGKRNFLVDSPACVGQAVLTRLLLFTDEWFLDLDEGTPYKEQILGNNTIPTYDIAIRERILRTQGVTGIAKYSSTFNSVSRSVAVQATIDTQYGQTQVRTVL